MLLYTRGLVVWLYECLASVQKVLGLNASEFHTFSVQMFWSCGRFGQLISNILVMYCTENRTVYRLMNALHFVYFFSCVPKHEAKCAVCKAFPVVGFRYTYIRASHSTIL